MWRKVVSDEAPSTRAASKYSRGIETIPAMKMTVASPTPFHTSTSATESSAYLGSTSQAGPSIPTRARLSLITPRSGCIRTVKVSPTPIVLTSTGKKTTDRMNAAADDARREQHRELQPEDRPSALT